MPSERPGQQVPVATLLTVDVERDWAGRGLRGVREVLPRLLELLDRHGAHATCFVVGELADEVARHLDPHGPHEVGSHGLDHRVLRGLSSDALRHQLAESRRLLGARGYSVDGFRAPWFKRPRGLDAALRGCGYRYDASRGSVWPSLANRRGQVRAPADDPEGLSLVGSATLRDGLLPFNLTWLRLLHPFGPTWVAPGATHFSCHLHELLEPADDAPGGDPGLPAALRRLHARAAGATAWGLLEGLLSDPGRRFVSVADWLATP